MNERVLLPLEHTALLYIYNLHYYTMSPEEASERKTIAWPAMIQADLDTCTAADYQAWLDLWQHATTATGSKPSARWLKSAKNLILPIADLSMRLAQWFEWMVIHSPKKADQPFSPNNSTVIKGLLWTASLGNEDILASSIANLVNFGYIKVKGKGARAGAASNAGLYALGEIGIKGVTQLTLLEQKIRYSTAQAAIQKALKSSAERYGMTAADLADIAVPDFQWQEAGLIQVSLGDYVGKIHMDERNKVHSHWLKNDKLLKSVPAPIKQSYKDELKEFKNTATTLATLLTGHSSRLEKSYREARVWTFDTWQKRWMEHGVLGWLAKKMIWCFEHEGTRYHGLWSDGCWQDAEGQRLPEWSTHTAVKLWHPIFSTVAEIQAWRTILTTQKIVQPFKQAFREVYLITPAEESAGTQSQRYAGHFIMQHKFADLCKDRDWQYRLQGDWDGANDAYFHASNNIHARLEINPTQDRNRLIPNPGGLFIYIDTGAVIFYDTTKNSETMALKDVPPLVFSEVMRDIDLFIGTCSIGTEATLHNTLQHPDLREYWYHSAANDLTASASVRKDALDLIISKLVIASQCHFEEKYLHVKGHLRTYKIHLGSGNILMTPNDQYLCIVPDHEAVEQSIVDIYLPFEGDLMLSLILSKALLLANDHSIKDESIFRQIKHV